LFVAFMSLYKFSFVLLCAAIYYFVNRSHSVFKFDLIRIGLQVIKEFVNEKAIFISFYGLGPNLPFPRIGPAGQLPAHPSSPRAQTIMPTPLTRLLGPDLTQRHRIRQPDWVRPVPESQFFTGKSFSPNRILTEHVESRK
jgi:hypothetical protein